MKKDAQEGFGLFALLGISRWLYIVFIIAISVIISVFSPRLDPMDDQYIKKREIVEQIYVTDDKNNGFRVVYVTKENVTRDRLYEIRHRDEVRDSLLKLQVEAPFYFGDMIHTDIYDFAVFAREYDPSDIKIHNIFVSGPGKTRLYAGNNPKIKNPATWINQAKPQGILYIESEDIYCNMSSYRKVYRYWQCRGIHQISEYDEHFSHFSEDERIY